MIQPTPTNYSQTAFKGLWGKTESKILCNYYNEAIDNTTEYYPFKDESSVEIDVTTGRKWRKPNPLRGMGSFDEFALHDGVDVMPKLPFTKKEYFMYKNYKYGLPELKTKVETALKSLKLYEYINDYKKPENALTGCLKSAFKKLCSFIRK